MKEEPMAVLWTWVVLAFALGLLVGSCLAKPVHVHVSGDRGPVQWASR